jgi:hypothetical protein
MARRPSVGVVALAVLLLSGCAATGDQVVALDAAPGDSPAPAAAQTVVPMPEHTATVTSGPRPDPPEDPEVSARLEADLAKQADFPADANRRPLVLMRPVEDTPDGFPNSTMKQDFEYGRWAIPAKLPKAPASAGGYPVMSARDALQVLRRAFGDAVQPGPAQLRVRSVRFDTAEVHTDRGPRRLPAWIVRFAEARGDAVVPAVARSARWTEAEGGPSSRNSTAQIDASGRVLTLPFDRYNPCGGGWDVAVRESAHAVAIAYFQRTAKPTTWDSPTCAENTISGGATGIRLAAPLGNRLLVWEGDPIEVLPDGPSRVTPLLDQ